MNKILFYIILLCSCSTTLEAFVGNGTYYVSEDADVYLAAKGRPRSTIKAGTRVSVVQTQGAWAFIKMHSWKKYSIQQKYLMSPLEYKKKLEANKSLDLEEKERKEANERKEAEAKAEAEARAKRIKEAEDEAEKQREIEEQEEKAALALQKEKEALEIKQREEQELAEEKQRLADEKERLEDEANRLAAEKRQLAEQQREQEMRMDEQQDNMMKESHHDPASPSKLTIRHWELKNSFKKEAHLLFECRKSKLKQLSASVLRGKEEELKTLQKNNKQAYKELLHLSQSSLDDAPEARRLLSELHCFLNDEDCFYQSNGFFDIQVLHVSLYQQIARGVGLDRLHHEIGSVEALMGVSVPLAELYNAIERAKGHYLWSPSRMALSLILVVFVLLVLVVAALGIFSKENKRS